MEKKWKRAMTYFFVVLKHLTLSLVEICIFWVSVRDFLPKLETHIIRS